MKSVHQQLHAEGRAVPWTQLCRLLGVARSTLYYQPRPHQRSEPWTSPWPCKSKRSSKSARIRRAQLTKARGLAVNRKKVRRIMRLKRWTVRHRPRLRALRARRLRRLRLRARLGTRPRRLRLPRAGLRPARPLRHPASGCATTTASSSAPGNTSASCAATVSRRNRMRSRR